MDQCPWPLPLVGAVRDEAAVAGVDASLSAAGADRALLSLIEGHEAASTATIKYNRARAPVNRPGISVADLKRQARQLGNSRFSLFIKALRGINASKSLFAPKAGGEGSHFSFIL